MRRTMLAVAVLAMALGACEIRAEIEVEEDGSGTFGFVFGMEEALFGSLPAGMDPLAGARADLADDPIPWQVEDFRERGLRGFRASARFDSVDHLLAMLEQQARADGQTPFATGDGGFVLERDAAGGWRFQATGEAPGASLNGSPLESFGGGFGEGPSFGGDFGDLGGDAIFAPDMPALPDGAASMLRFEFHVTLPGDAAESNADQVRRSGGTSTFVWRFDLSDDAPAMLSASTAPASGSLPAVPLAAGALIVLAGGLVWSRRKRTPGGPPPVVLEGFGAALSDEEVAAAVAGPDATFEQPSLLDELTDGAAERAAR